MLQIWNQTLLALAPQSSPNHTIYWNPVEHACTLFQQYVISTKWWL